MNRLKIYSFSFLFLFVALIFTILLAQLSSILPGQGYYDPVGMLFCFGPALASLFFILIIKNDSIKSIPLRKFSFKPLLYVLILYSFIVLIEKSIQLIFGFIELQYSYDKVELFNTKINRFFGYAIFLFFAIAYSGFGEEFGWRGYLLHKLKGLSWLEITLFLNLIWALWHIPLFIFGGMVSGNLVINFTIFTVSAIELGIILLYLRIKTKSVIPTIILHGFVNFFNGIIYFSFIKVDNLLFAGKPANIIIIIILLPFSIYFYFKGKKLYENETAQ